MSAWELIYNILLFKEKNKALCMQKGNLCIKL